MASLIKKCRELRHLGNLYKQSEWVRGITGGYIDHRLIGRHIRRHIDTYCVLGHFLSQKLLSSATDAKKQILSPNYACSVSGEFFCIRKEHRLLLLKHSHNFFALSYNFLLSLNPFLFLHSSEKKMPWVTMKRIKVSNVKIKFFKSKHILGRSPSPGVFLSPTIHIPCISWWQGLSTMSLFEFGANLLQRGFQAYRETGTGPILDLACRPCHHHQRQWRTKLETELTLP